MKQQEAAGDREGVADTGPGPEVVEDGADGASFPDCQPQDRVNIRRRARHMTWVESETRCLGQTGTWRMVAGETTVHLAFYSFGVNLIGLVGIKHRGQPPATVYMVAKQ